MCDAKAKEIIMNAEKNVMNKNVRHHREKVIIKDCQLASLPVKELIREVDAEE